MAKTGTTYATAESGPRLKFGHQIPWGGEFAIRNPGPKGNNQESEKNHNRIPSVPHKRMRENDQPKTDEAPKSRVEEGAKCQRVCLPPQNDVKIREKPTSSGGVRDV